MAAPHCRIRDCRWNYFEPDMIVICPHNESDDRLQTNGCHGAQDWVIEIVSPPSRTMDHLRKLNKYQETGVREYWIVNAKTENVLVYQFGEHPATILIHSKILFLWESMKISQSILKNRKLYIIMKQGLNGIKNIQSLFHKHKNL